MCYFDSMPVTVLEAASELLLRRRARAGLLQYITYTNPRYLVSVFSEVVCVALDKFIEDVKAGKRPILILQAPPQHGKSEIVSRKLPAFLLGTNPLWRIGTASYSSELANTMAQDVRRNLASPEHQRLFPVPTSRVKYSINRMGEFTAPGGAGGYLAVGIGQGLTGRPVDIGIIDDPIKDQQEALSEVTKESHWSWYQSVFTTRLSENSGQIIMATSWAEDDLPARIATHYGDDPRLTHLKFPAINDPEELGFNPSMPLGALVPQLHSLEKLREQRGLMSDYWWSAVYCQSPRPMGGNVFKDIGIQYYWTKDLPERFEKVIDSWDCTFKDTDGTDYVCGGKWAKKGSSVYLMPKIFHDRMGFVDTAAAVRTLSETAPLPHKVLIEDKANGPAVIDFLKKDVPRLFAVEPDGSKLARAYAVTSVWEARNVFIPHPDWCPWVKLYIKELTGFPAASNDDWVDMTTQALRELYPLFGRLSISPEVLKRAAQR